MAGRNAALDPDAPQPARVRKDAPNDAYQYLCTMFSCLAITIRSTLNIRSSPVPAFDQKWAVNCHLSSPSAPRCLLEALTFSVRVERRLVSQASFTTDRHFLLVQPIGMVEEMSINEEGGCTPKQRLTHDSSNKFILFQPIGLVLINGKGHWHLIKVESCFGWKKACFDKSNLLHTLLHILTIL